MGLKKAPQKAEAEKQNAVRAAKADPAKRQSRTAIKTSHRNIAEREIAARVLQIRGKSTQIAARNREIWYRVASPSSWLAARSASEWQREVEFKSGKVAAVRVEFSHESPFFGLFFTPQKVRRREPRTVSSVFRSSDRKNGQPR